MNSVSIRHSHDSRVLPAYGDLLAHLLPQAWGFALYDSHLALLDVHGEVPEGPTSDWLHALNLPAQRPEPLPAHHHPLDAKHWLVALEMRDAQQALLGLLVAHLGKKTGRKTGLAVVAEAAERLYPLLPVLKREFVTEPQPEAMQQGATVIGWLREALAQDRMQLYAQRIMPLQDFSRASGYELLVRLRDKDGHIIAPEEFLSAAYRYQLLPAVDRWVMEHALMMLAPYGNLLRRNGITIAINISGQSLGDQVFVQRLADRLAEAGVAPDNLMLEMAEPTAVANRSQAIDMSRQLRQIGVPLALDDFGTRGASSLDDLVEFSAARVKIDGSLIRNLLTQPQAEETVKAIVKAAKARHVETVAEFVENEGLARKVRALGIDCGQGYMFAKPEPLEQVLKAMEKDASRRANLGDV